MQKRLFAIYGRLADRFGPRGWWPARSRFEVCVGAVLTQNTAWRNVENAIENLRRAGRLSARGILELGHDELAALIRPAGYFNVKARRLRALTTFLHKNGGSSLGRFKAVPTGELRARLLEVYGVGEETADSILLYALDRPVFVIDAYTRRISARLGLTDESVTYGGLQAFFTRHLPQDTALFNDYHAQLVALGNRACRPRPLCSQCPLDDLCPKVGVG